MTTISNTPVDLQQSQTTATTDRAAATTAAPAADSSANTSGNDSPAYILSISPSGQVTMSNASSPPPPPAQAPVTYSASSDTTASGNDSPSSTKSAQPAPPAHGGGGGGGVSYTEVSDDADLEKQKYIPVVGPTGANEVVDSKGNVDHNELNRLIAQNAAKYHTSN